MLHYLRSITVCNSVSGQSDPITKHIEKHIFFATDAVCPVIRFLAHSVMDTNVTTHF